MRWSLERRAGDDYTPGALWVPVPNQPAAERLCYTLELPKPIPAGEYPLAMTLSGRAQKGTLWTPRDDYKLLELVGVPGHTAIRIHAGNTAHDTEGCILVGLGLIGGTLSQSRDALRVVMARWRPGDTLTVKEPAQ